MIRLNELFTVRVYTAENQASSQFRQFFPWWIRHSAMALQAASHGRGERISLSAIRRKSEMLKYRPILATVVAILFYTATDILIWQRIFETNQMIEHADMYHTGWFASLAGYATIGLILMWGAWKDCLYYLLSLLICAFSGLEDVLYYLMDGKPIPDSLPWLDPNPMIYDTSRLGLVLSVAFWIAMLGVIYFLMYEWRKNRPTSLV
jgi:hypothetical protein